VVEHWTSDGEHYHFRYDLDARTSWATDVLGRELEVQYNADHRVIASRDYGGERYAIALDENGNMVGLDLPDGNRLTFKYDEFARLLEETDPLGRKIQYEYHHLTTLVTQVSYPDGSTWRARYDDKGNLLAEFDALGQMTEYLNSDDGLPHTIIDATYKSKYLWWNTLAQVERYQDCSGKSTYYRYDERQHLVAVTDALNQTTSLERKPDGQVISDMERDDLHREVYRTQGKLTSCFGYDAMGRKAWQFASTLPADKLSQVHNTGINTSLLVEHAYNPIHRRYQYDPAGELVRTLDKLRGEIKYEYEANGQLRSRDTGSLVGSEEFRYDAAANRLDFNARQFAKVKDNRIKQWRDQEYSYDPWGNLVEKRSGHSKLQHFAYDCENRLVRAETLVNGKLESTGQYRYDSLGRRVAKQAEINGLVEQKRFLWQGLRMLREETPGQNILYLYEPGSYAPLARVDQAEGEEQKLYYFHTDQIGTPLELTDGDGKIVWQATYRSWGAVEHLAADEIEQNIRFQGQYFDAEAGLHYNTFRCYDAEVGRFTIQDPIGLLGGIHLYQYALNPSAYVDPLGLSFGSGKGAHNAIATLYDSRGNVRATGIWQSGNMTPDEAALGFPKSTLATHTEARITRELSSQARTGDRLLIEGEYPPCNSCKGKMNAFKGSTGADVEYRWPLGDGTSKEVWNAKSKKAQNISSSGCA